MNRRQLLSLAALPVALAVPAGLWACEGRRPICAEDGVALGGADTVAYFQRGSYVPGRERFALMWRGAVWRFAGPETMAAFEMDPHAFAPQFGGYCALAMANGMLATGVPEAWIIRDNKLYVCSNLLALAAMRRDVPGTIARAEASWPAILDS